MADTTKVVFALDYETADGKQRKGGQEYALEPAEARDLIHRGLAQLAAKENPAATQQDVPVHETAKGGK